MTSLRFDHVLIGVMDLEQAITDYQSLGFTTFFGGTHSHGLTHNGLIVFADGSYIELIAPTDPSKVGQDDGSDPLGVLLRFTAGEGFVGFALHSASIEADVAAIRSRGLEIGNPVGNGRLRPDGERIAWRTAIIENQPIPFIITDVTPRVLRVQDDTALITHENGVTGFANIITLTDSLEQGNRLYHALLGTDPAPDESLPGVPSTRFDLASGKIILAAPSDEVAVADYHRERGNVPYQLTLKTSASGKVGKLEEQLAHNAWINLIPSS